MREGANTNTERDDSDVPSVNVEKEKILNISRDDAIKSSKRINFENENVKGSISLKGLLIDDIIFKKYNKDVDSDEKVKYLNPSETKTILNCTHGDAKHIVTTHSLMTKRKPLR